VQGFAEALDAEYRRKRENATVETTVTAATVFVFQSLFSPFHYV
jgi:hypothetical protein